MLILWTVQVAGQDFTISTIAGGAPPPTPAVATSASIGSPLGVAVDATGKVYFASDKNCVFKLDASGILTLVAGNSRPGYAGDGGPATSAQLNYYQEFTRAVGIAVDSAGNVYVADTFNQRIRRVSPSGVIATVAGTGEQGFSGDGGLATSARLSNPTGVALDGAGNLYIADTDNKRIRRVSPAGVITTVPGGSNVDLVSIAADGTGNLYIVDSNTATVRSVSPSGAVAVVFSTGLSYPTGVAVDGAGILYVADSSHHRVVRRVGPSIFTPVAGTGDSGFSGDGGVASSARLSAPVGVAVNPAGNLYIADRNNYRIRRMSAPSGMSYSGIISTVAGNGNEWYSGDGGPATSAQISYPDGVALDGAGNLFISDDHRIRRVSPSGIITTVAGTGVAGYSGDNGPATSAQINAPIGVVVDGAGNLFFADFHAFCVRRVSPAGIITTVAGNGKWGFSGDGGPATSAQVSQPDGLALDAAGNLYIADWGNGRIRRVSPSGIIATVAGGGSSLGDGGQATSARVSNPRGIAVDVMGNLYIAEQTGERIRRVSPAGIITTVTGTGTGGFSGDGGPATSAQVRNPLGVAVDGTGNLYIADSGNHRIRRVSPSATPFQPPLISTVAGDGTELYSGDGGPASSAQIPWPRTLTLDSAGRVYVTTFNAIRMLAPTCTASATPAVLAAPPGGGPLTLTIQATLGCPWTITGVPAWITASATSGSGASTVILTAAANWLAPRSATVTAAGTAVTISQDMSGGVCVPPLISPVGQAFTSAGGTGYVGVSTRAGCGWSAVSQVAWITVTSGASGSGDGTVNYQVLPNTLGTPRSGTIIVAGSTFTVQQSSSNFQCGYSVSTSDLGVAASGGTVVLTILADPGCAWSVSGLPAWLTVSGSSQGSGAGNVSLTAASNPDGARSASVSIGGVAVPIRQFDSSVCGGSSSCVVRALPHVAAGGEWTTSLFAVSSGAAGGSFTVSFFGDDGSSLALPFTGGGNLSTLSDSVPVQGRKDYEAGNAGLPLQGGWGLLMAEKSITAQAAFRRATPSGSFYEAAVLANEGYSGFIIPFDASAFPPTGGPLYTGFAIANLNPNAAAHVTCTARDEWGTVVPNAVTIPTLNPSGHHANYLFPALTGKRGTLDCTADTLISAIALRFIGTDAFSTLPVIVK